MGIIQWDFAQGHSPVCGDKRYEHIKMNWHPSPSGHRMDSGMIAYYLIRSALQFIQKYKSEIARLAPKDLDAFLSEKSGNWIKYFYTKDINHFPSPKFCLPYCTTVPYSLIPFHPMEWNIGFRMQDYVLNNNLTESGWKLGNFDFEQESWFDDKIGGQASVDHKFVYLPMEGSFDRFYTNYKRSNEKNWDMYCRQKEYDLRVSIKIPSNGHGSLFVSTGVGENRFGQLYNLYLERLYDAPQLNFNNNDKPWFLGLDLSFHCDNSDDYAVGCHIHNLTKGEKYYLSVVVKDVKNIDMYKNGIGVIAVNLNYYTKINQASVILKQLLKKFFKIIYENIIMKNKDIKQKFRQFAVKI
ncbi:hypothetical protein RFI_07939 [Reticulomyxa filosa]|uniref:Uncharacterized protein n=1 Tax=Reticulomyxa filosa TaxID=46433 RepID=X6NT51_RETFI|nr:hypothetical protein RFI_07939 [Reticulomyxa filosa]|eukprot:ETO29191.1 hypothetical protein RFI_07939 [Reticulomyxa filosa]